MATERTSPETDEQYSVRMRAFKAKLLTLIANEPRQDEIGGFLLAFGAGRMLLEEGLGAVDVREQLEGALEEFLRITEPAPGAN